MKFIVLGGKQGASDLNKDEWNRFDEALIGELDITTGEIEIVKSYKSPDNVTAKNDPPQLFKSGSIFDGKLYCCTPTEVVIFDLSNYEICDTISLPSFNDLHHVIVPSSGGILVVSTGLDLVQHIDVNGKLIREWDVLNPEKPQTWEKFNRQIDYRKVPTTKPHQSHPNHVYEYKGDFYVTRFKQRDVINLTTGKRFPIDVEGPHDGIICNGIGQYTTVDGHLIFVDLKLGQPNIVKDLSEMRNKRRRILGWCRSLCQISEDEFLVGFSRLRATKFKENLKWVQYTLQNKELIPSQIMRVNIKTNKIIEQFNLENVGLNVVFSILPIQ